MGRYTEESIVSEVAWLIVETIDELPLLNKNQQYEFIRSELVRLLANVEFKTSKNRESFMEMVNKHRALAGLPGG